MKSHLKRLFTPKTWNILKKKNKYITRPKPGMHSFKEGMSINTLLKEVIGYANTTKDVMNILNKKELLIDGKRVKEKRFVVGLMDLIGIPETKETFRIIFNDRGNIIAIPATETESKLKLCKVKSKSLNNKKINLHLHDGRNILTDKKDIKVMDSVLIEVPGQKISNHIKFEVGCLIYFIAGKKIGQTAKLKEIKGDKIICSSKDGDFETSKSYAFVVGTDKPVITIKQ